MPRSPLVAALAVVASLLVGCAAIVDRAVLDEPDIAPPPEEGRPAATPVDGDGDELLLPVPEAFWTGRVTFIADGDTLNADVVEDGGLAGVAVGERRKLRLLRIDTPETEKPDQAGECHADAATEALTALAPRGSTVRVTYDVEVQDQYGRDLVHLWNEDGTWVNGALLLGGYARVVTFPPNNAHTDLVLELERRARGANRGLWDPSICP